jgi:polar amino acid transport system substrate-binding protein
LIEKEDSMRRLLTWLALGAAAMTQAHAGATLDRVMKKKSMVVATNSGWPPQSYLDNNNEMVGFDIDVSREIAKRLGVAFGPGTHTPCR